MPQHTYRLDQLQPGTIYRCALSGYLVLVRQVVHRGPTLGDPKQPSEVKRLVGWYWNPVWGKHTEMELHDHQLISSEYPTSLKPDTRGDAGYYGK